CATPIAPELRLDRAEQHEPAVGRLVVLVLRRTACATRATGTADAPLVVEFLRVERCECTEPLGSEDRIGAGHVDVAPVAGRARTRETARHPERGVQWPDHHTTASADRVTGRGDEPFVVKC